MPRAVTTVEEIVEAMEARYGLAQRIWVMDRGIPTEETLGEMRDVKIAARAVGR